MNKKYSSSSKKRPVSKKNCGQGHRFPYWKYSSAQLSAMAKSQNRNADGTFAKGFKQYPGRIYGKSKSRINSPKGTLSSYPTSKKGLVSSVLNMQIADRNKRDEVIAAVARNFSIDEIKRMDDQGKPLVISDIGKIEQNAKKEHIKAYGYYDGRRHPGEVAEINLAPNSDEYAIVHEFIHHERIVDNTRTGFAKTAHKLRLDGTIPDKETGEVKNAEESAAHCETLLRVSHPATKSHISSFYSDQNNRFNEDARIENYYHDRNVMRKNEGHEIPDGVTIKGKMAKNLVNENFPQTRLSNRRDGSRAIEYLKRLIIKRGGR